MKKARRNRGSSRQVAVAAGMIIIAGLFLSYFVIPALTSDVYNVAGLTDKTIEQTEAQNNAVAGKNSVIETPPTKHVATPAAVKGIYVSACAAGSPSFRSRLTDLLKTTELNAMVIDIKDFSGTISFVPEDEKLKDFVSKGCPVKDMKEFIAHLHDEGIYVIGRITTFQDPLFAKLHPELAVKTESTQSTWKDRKGLSYLDPGAKETWDHIVSISLASYQIGFDELNFDYIRFPSDGNMQDIYYTYSNGKSKPEVLESFYVYLYDNLKKSHGIPISADLFGMTTTNTDDLGIGQVLERAMPYFDYIDPMVYPSHYPATFNGWVSPNAHPYELIKYVMGTAVKRTIATSSIIKTLQSDLIASTSPKKYTKESYNKQKMRPWLQDFDLGQPAYGPAEVRAQIQATYDVGLTSWLLWDAANRYTPGALEAE